MADTQFLNSQTVGPNQIIVDLDFEQPRNHRCWRRMLDTKSVGDNFSMLATSHVANIQRVAPTSEKRSPTSWLQHQVKVNTSIYTSTQLILKYYFLSFIKLF